VTDEQVQIAVDSYLENQSINGLSYVEKNLMMTLFKNIPYTTDMSATIKALGTKWGSSIGGGIGGGTANITYNLTGVTSDFTDASVTVGTSLVINLSANTNSTLGAVSVVMNGEDVTDSVYSNGKINIPSVTGDVVITATATVANYTEVEYLEQAGTSYIDTGHALAKDELVEVEFLAHAVDWSFIFCATDKTKSYHLRTRPDNTVGRTAFTRRAGGKYTDVAPTAANFALSADTIYKFTETDVGTGVLSDVNGSALVTLTDENASQYDTDGGNIVLFMATQFGDVVPTTAKVGMRIYSFKVKDVYGNVVVDIIPVKDENGVACMYDKVSKQLLYDGTGNNGFIAGGEI
jgi:hypothetical protein